MWNAEWLRLNDTLRVIARNEAIQTISIQNNGNEQKADCVSGRPFFRECRDMTLPYKTINKPQFYS